MSIGIVGWKFNLTLLDARCAEKGHHPLKQNGIYHETWKLHENIIPARTRFCSHLRISENKSFQIICYFKQNSQEFTQTFKRLSHVFFWGASKNTSLRGGAKGVVSTCG